MRQIFDNAKKGPRIFNSILNVFIFGKINISLTKAWP